jgi:hypothetical protein
MTQIMRAMMMLQRERGMLNRERKKHSDVLQLTKKREKICACV